MLDRELSTGVFFELYGLLFRLWKQSNFALMAKGWREFLVMKKALWKYVSSAGGWEMGEPKSWKCAIDVEMHFDSSSILVLLPPTLDIPWCISPAVSNNFCRVILLFFAHAIWSICSKNHYEHNAFLIASRGSFKWPLARRVFVEMKLVFFFNDMIISFSFPN